MTKLKVGDYVKALEEDTDIAVSKNELGIVASVGKKDKDGDRAIELFFVDTSGDFAYPISAYDKEVEFVGKKLKWVKPSKIEVGDVVAVDGDPDDADVHVEVFTVEQIDVEPAGYNAIGKAMTQYTFSGDGYEVVVSGASVKEKVPVVR